MGIFRRQRAALGLAALSLAALALPAHAARPFRLVHSLDLEGCGVRTTDRPVVVDRGRALTVGTVEEGQMPSAQLVRLSDHKRQSLDLPMRRTRQQATGRLRHDLAFWDSPSQRAGWLLTSETPRQRRVVYAEIAVADSGGRDQVTQLVELSRSDPRARPTELTPLGFAHHTGDFFYVERSVLPGRRGAPGRSSVTLNRVDHRGAPWLIRQIDTQTRIHDVHFDARGQRALVAEYGVHPGPAPQGHLVGLRSGRVTRFTIPATAYAFAFSPDGATVWAYSNQLSELWTIDAATGERTQRSQAGPLGHALGRVLPGRLALVRDHGLELIDTRRGKRMGWLPMKRITRGAVHTDGSLIAGDQVIVKTGDALHFVRVASE